MEGLHCNSDLLRSAARIEARRRTGSSFKSSQARKREGERFLAITLFFCMEYNSIHIKAVECKTSECGTTAAPPPWLATTPQKA